MKYRRGPSATDYGLILVTKASHLPRNVGCSVPGVVWKLLESVTPVTKTSRAVSSAMPDPNSPPLPPK